jgi:hypothetical protein
MPGILGNLEYLSFALEPGACGTKYAGYFELGLFPYAEGKTPWFNNLIKSK